MTDTESESRKHEAMMMDRNSAVIYEGFYDGVQELDTAEEKVEAYNAYCRLAFYGESYTGDNKDIRILLKAFEKKVKKAGANYNDTINKRREAGRLGGLKKAENAKKEEQEKEEQKQETEKPKKVAPIRHKFGAYKHVMLTDEQYQKLCNEHGKTDTDLAIQIVDNYCEQTGKTYKNYSIVLNKWGYRSLEESRAKQSGSRKPNQFDFGETNTYNDDAIAMAMFNRTM